MTIFTDMRIAKFIKLGERMKLEGSVDMLQLHQPVQRGRREFALHGGRHSQRRLLIPASSSLACA